MLALTRKEEQSIILYPSLDTNPEMTISELFKVGPIRIMLGNIRHNQAKNLISAPNALEIVRLELVQRSSHLSPEHI